MFYLFYRIYGHFVFRSPQPPPLWGRTTGAVRPEDYPRREGCVRDKWEAQKPTTALASGLNRRIVAFAGTLFGIAKTGAFAGLQANRPRFLTLRLRAVLLPLQAIMRNTSRRETRRITPVYSHIYLFI